MPMIEDLHLIPSVEDFRNTAEPPEPYCYWSGPYFLSLLMALSNEVTDLSVVPGRPGTSWLKTCRLLMEGKVVDERAVVLQKAEQLNVHSSLWGGTRPVKIGAPTKLILSGVYEDYVLASMRSSGGETGVIGRPLGPDFNSIDDKRSGTKNEYIKALLSAIHAHRNGRTYHQMFQEFKQKIVAQQRRGAS